MNHSLTKFLHDFVKRNVNIIWGQFDMAAMGCEEHSYTIHIINLFIIATLSSFPACYNKCPCCGTQKGYTCAIRQDLPLKLMSSSAQILLHLSCALLISNLDVYNNVNFVTVVTTRYGIISCTYYPLGRLERKWVKT